ncbi:MAG: YebC/PmpR family DNA-binding transcriptional regulator, partial [Pseudomonadota bacterium]
ALEKAGIPFEGARISMIPKTTQNVKGKEAGQMVRLLQALEDSEDVQEVYTNADIDDEALNAE